MDQPAPLPAQPSLTHAEIRTTIGGVLLAMLLAALDQTIVATAMPTIGHELGDMEHLSWVVTAYLLAATAVTPLYGKISDIHGRRVTLLFAIVIFVIGSIACALAPSMLALILARGLQGLGGGGLISLAQTVIADVVSPRERTRYQAHIASVFGASSVAGPVLGGFFADHLHWSFIFWINVPLGLLAFIISNRVLKKLPRYERRHKLDILGALLMTSASITLMLALNWGGVRFPWGSAPVLGMFGVSALFWLMFVLRLRSAPEPLIPGVILSNQVVAMGTIAACFGMGVFIGLTIYMPIYFQAVHGLSASHAGLALIPLMAGTVTGATLSGRIMAHFRHYKRLPMLGICLSISILSLLAYMPKDLSLVQVSFLLGLSSLGLGTVLPVTTICIQNAVMQHQMGTATGTMNFFRQLGGAMIVAAFGAIVLSSLPPEATGAGVSMEMLASLVKAAGADLTDTFRWVFAASACGMSVTLLALIVMQERPLRTELSIDRVAGE